MLDIEKLRKKLKYRLEKEKREFATKSMHLVESPLKAGTELFVGPHKYPVPKDTFLVIIDEAPGAYWTHPVRYELHDIETGEVTVIHEEYPLEMPDIKEELVTLHTPDLPQLKKKGDEDFFEVPQLELGELEEQMATISYGLSCPCAAHKHALFVAGMDNMPDFHNDFVNMKDILVERYGYDPNNIAIAMGSGPPGYDDLPVGYPGTVAGLDQALNEYAPGGTQELGPDDTLFLYTFNHGGWDGTNAYLCMHPSWGSYYDYQLLSKLNNIHCGNLIVVMNQCHSGGFIDQVVTTTGPDQVSIMTACRYDQCAFRAATGGAHGYFSVVLYTALNWGFPDTIDPAFPGWLDGTITSHDINSDGMISAEEAWQFVHDMMHANHFATINGWETPQSAASPMEASDIMFWGLPDIEVEDGTPWWESPDIYLHNPGVIPDGYTANPQHQANWGDSYHPDTVNRIVARVHNKGCAPARNISVEFRAFSFGTGGGLTVLGTFWIDNIDPGHHEFAWVDWNFPSNLVHKCIKVRADCAGDPAEPFGTSITADDNQAQRNVDPLYSAPSPVNREPAGKVIERTFTVCNDLDTEAVFRISLSKDKYRSRLVQAEVLKAESGLESLPDITLKPGEVKKIRIRFSISPKAQKGEKSHYEVAVQRIRPKPTALGGVSFVIEIAEGHLEGRIVSRRKMPITKGTVTIRNIKQMGQKYSAEVKTNGTFSFGNIDPGPYRIQAKCKEGTAKGSVLVKPNTITGKVLRLRYHDGQPVRPPGLWIPSRGVLTDERGNPLAHTLVALEDTETNQKHLVRTDAKGKYIIPGIRPGEYEITTPEKKEMGPKKVMLDTSYPEEEE